jgi:4-amino-4-deoxy-L-arabinose transferase-like glycosyltransferase
VRRWLPWLAVFALALTARWTFAATLPSSAPVASVDAQGYQALALNLLDGHGFTLNTAPPFVPDGIRTPLYPALVAALYAASGRVPAHVALFQGLVDAITALVVVDVVRRLTSGGWLAWAAGLAYALNPTAWRFSNELLTEAVLAAVLAWLLWAFVRYAQSRRLAWLGLAGALTGIALLVKPNVAALPSIVALAAMLLPAAQTNYRQRLAPALVVLIIAAVLVFPWLARNRLIFGRWLFSHAFDNNLARVSAVATLVSVQGERVAPWTPRWEALYSGLLLAAEARYGDDFVGVPATARQADRTQRQLAAVAADVIRQHPRAFALAHLSGFVRSWVPQEHRFWFGRIAGRTWDSLATQESVLGRALERLRSAGLGAALNYVWRARFAELPPLALALWLGWLVAYAVSALLLARATWRWRCQPALLVLFWGTILYVTFLPGPIGDIRFRVPVVPWLLVLMAAGLGRPSLPRARSGAPMAGDKAKAA